ncbi:MAG TPA: hypothetical protein VMR75_00780 [Candidatus Saccharimonadales bacterium]|nr:hypothetical protein [Candidatus Saccharimonadales bacterium]
MTRRLLVQFGVAALGLVLTTGMALADSTDNGSVAPSTPTGQSGQTGSQVAGNTTSQIINITSNNQTTGTGAGSNSGGASSGGTGTNLTGGPTLNTPIAPGAGLSSGSGVTQVQPPAGTAQNPSASDNGTALPAASGSTTSPTSSQSVATFSSQPAAIARAVQRAVAVASAASPTNQPELIATTAPSMPQQSSPGLPHAPVGFLVQLPLLMTQVLVPLLHSFPLTDFPTGLAVSLVIGLFLLAKLLSQLPVNTHTARLRRSGFLGAARSDVSVANLLFATPREMSFIYAYAT